MANAVATTTLPGERRAISPLARRLARMQGQALDGIRGSGPYGRIVAADILRAKPPRHERTVHSAAGLSAFAVGLDLTALAKVLDDFAAVQQSFGLEDAILRASGCALDDATEVTSPPGKPVALELGGRQLVFTDIRASSLGPLRNRRLAATSSEQDHSDQPAALSVRVLTNHELRPVLMPLLSQRSMRLTIAVSDRAGEALLSFDAGVVAEEAAAQLLLRVKAYLESPLLLLA